MQAPMASLRHQGPKTKREIRRHLDKYHYRYQIVPKPLRWMMRVAKMGTDAGRPVGSPPAATTSNVLAAAACQGGCSR